MASSAVKASRASPALLQGHDYGTVLLACINEDVMLACGHKTCCQMKFNFSCSVQDPADAVYIRQLHRLWCIVLCKAPSASYKHADHGACRGCRAFVTMVLVRVQATDTPGADQSSASRRSRFKEGLNNLMGKSSGN